MKMRRVHGFIGHVEMVFDITGMLFLGFCYFFVMRVLDIIR